MAKYTFAKEIRGETKVTNFINVKDFFFLIAFIGLSYVARGYVHVKFRALYMIFSIFVAITLTIPSPINHGRRMYQSIMIYLRKDECRYRPVKKKRSK